MNPLYGAVLAAPIVGAVFYAAIAWVEHRRQNPPRRLEAVLADTMRAQGFRRAVMVVLERYRATAVPLQAAIESEQDAIRVGQEKLDRHRGTLVESHPNLIGYGAFVVALTVLGGFCFMASRSLDVGLIQTLGIGDLQAEVIGSVIAIFTAIVGLPLVELMLPSNAFPALQNLRHGPKIAAISVLVMLFVATVGTLVQLAPRRAEAALGVVARDARAACELTQADSSATSAERLQACAAADTATADLAAAIQWDQLVAVAAPVGELFGTWGLLRAIELLVIAWLGRSVGAARKRLAAVQTQLQQHFAQLVALVTAAAVDAGIEAEEILAWRGTLIAPEGTDRDQPGAGEGGLGIAGLGPDDAAPAPEVTVPPDDVPAISTTPQFGYDDDPRFSSRRNEPATADPQVFHTNGNRPAASPGDSLWSDF